LDDLSSRTSKHNNNLTLKTMYSNNSQNESELNYGKRFNRINQIINSTTMTPSFHKNKINVLNKKNKLKKNNMFEISIESKNNRTQIINQNNNINLSRDKYKKENKLSPRQRNENKTPINSHETIKEEKETKTIEEYKQNKVEEKEIEKEKERDKQNENNNNINIEINIENYDGNDIYENIKKNKDNDNKSEEVNDDYANNEDERNNNKSYDDEERIIENDNHKEYIKIIRKKDNIDNENIINEDLQNKNKTNTEMSDLNCIDDKFKFVHTLDSFSLPTVSQEKNILSFSKNNMEMSIPQCELNNKSALNKKEPVIKIKINRFKKKQNLTTKLIKTRSKLRLNIKKDKNKDKEKNITNYFDNKNIRKTKNETKNRNSQTKYFKKIEGNNLKKKYLKNNSSGNNLFNSELRETNRSRAKKNSIKHNNDYSRTENTYVLINNMCSINQKDKNNELFDTEKNKSNKSKEKDEIKMNNDTKSENDEKKIKIKNKNKKNCHHIKYNSIDNERDFYRYNRYTTSEYASTPSNIGDSNLIRINTVNIIKKKRSKNRINKFTLEEKVFKPEISYGKIYKNKNEGKSVNILNRNCKNNNKKKAISDMLSSMNFTLNQRNTFSIDRMDIRNKNIASPKNKRINNLFLNSLQNFFSNQEKNKINNEQTYEPVDLNCIFSLPRKNIKEKLLKGMENFKCRVKQISLYKYNVIFGDKRNIYEFNLPLSNLGVVKVKKIKGNNKDFVNDVRKIIGNKLI